MNPSTKVVLPGARDARDADRSLTPVGHGYTREEIVELQKDRLRDAVVQVVSEDGFENAGIKAICSRAGVGLATFYEHFHSKNELVFAAYDAGVADLFVAVSAAYSTPPDGTDNRDRIEVGILALLETLAENPAFATFFLVEIHKAGQEAHERVEGALDAAFELFTDVEPDSGLVAPDPEMVPLLVGGIYAHLSRYVRIGRTAELPRLLPSLMKFSEAVMLGAGTSSINLRPPR
ncbi:TetR/AcrR family transcriptional regulator [Nocardioides marmoriginsengisoli]|uniref:TetR/AcrR family transcriptional regulator n=1 Tax=Nocardioides marmoriginsengisoli TaxID=661483 RepID=A0A3N0CH41_9ACTN|nr:TetR/AcrR family transcriptional regulator [Nocardioides marmoriginsengisoli]RNL62323.1 TetR/AcrR family transcriptional regulator [Nocardioides marmoriginsengisoli]